MANARSRRVPAPPSVSHDSASVRGSHYAPSAHRLRPQSSRFSLRDGFATTRNEFEFGFDDASTIASEAPWEDGPDGAPAPPPGHPGCVVPVYRDYYELLCLPRDPSLSAEDVQKQFRRLVQVLSIERQPPRLQTAAAFNLALAQSAMETLADPCRRIGYDLSLETENEWEGVEMAAEKDLDQADGGEAYGRALREQYLLLSQGGIRSTTDMGLRLEAGSPPHSRRRLRERRLGLNMLDVSMRQSVTAPVPALREPIEKTAVYLLDLAERKWPKVKPKHLRFADPTVTVVGGAHGLLDEPFRLAPLLIDSYQPPGPSVHGRRRINQLLASGFLPALSYTIRQEINWRNPELQDPLSSTQKPLPDTIIEQEVQLLPHALATLRLGHSIPLPHHQPPLHVELSLQKGPLQANRFAPSLSLALHRTTGPGTAFALLDSGDWHLSPSLPRPFRHTPTLELRTEIELSRTTAFSDFYLALRTLAPVGRFSTLGLELGLSPRNIHLSLSFARLNQRFTLPLVVAQPATMSSGFMFWATAGAFAAFAAVEVGYRGLIKPRWYPEPPAPAQEKPSKEAVGRHVARRRAEADEMTVLLAAGVEPRQERERKAGGLVILSAKFGVRDASPDEVADVTIAVAALVEDGGVVIPEGVRKGRNTNTGEG
ncbi:hypothetical protein B0T18DRAFT_385868 [Schizothecium vesticola]|uniref:J domain-containing protein n=1 Tax=Schizothecium vesticola TaxID=314040 RepID=A0AA40FA74_9PEZI|nr:hypothetical protein B0T18DRAFT_385868 [Schizothecium vesticola]